MVSDKETNRFGFSVLKDSVSLLKTMHQTVDLIATSNYTSQNRSNKHKHCFHLPFNITGFHCLHEDRVRQFYLMRKNM